MRLLLKLSNPKRLLFVGDTIYCDGDYTAPRLITKITPDGIYLEDENGVDQSWVWEYSIKKHFLETYSLEPNGPLLEELMGSGDI